MNEEKWEVDYICHKGTSLSTKHNAKFDNRYDANLFVDALNKKDAIRAFVFEVLFIGRR